MPTTIYLPYPDLETALRESLAGRLKLADLPATTDRSVHITDRSIKWDLVMLAKAKFNAMLSKDPSTKCGAVISRDNKVYGEGYNGFARRVQDRPEWYADRAIKYEVVIHAENNAIIDAGGENHDSTITTWPFMCCSRCAAMAIQAGIVRHVAPVTPPSIAERWKASTDLSLAQFADAGVEVVFYDFAAISTA